MIKEVVSLGEDGVYYADEKEKVLETYKVELRVMTDGTVKAVRI